MVPKVEGAVGHPLRRSPARPARGQGRPRAPDPRPRDPRDVAGRHEPRGDRDGQPAHAGHELRPGRPGRLAAHEDHARRRRAPRLPRDRGPRSRTTRTRRARAPSRTRGTTRSPAWSTPARRPGSCPSTVPIGDIKDVLGCETQFRAAFLLGCVGAWSLHPVQIDIAKKVFSPDPDEVAFAKKVIEAIPDGARRAHDRRQDAGRRHLEAVPRHGRPGRAAGREGPRAGRGLRDGRDAGMRFFEYEAREIVKRAGIPVTDYGFATTPQRGARDRRPHRRPGRHQVPGPHGRADEGRRRAVRRHARRGGREGRARPRAGDQRPHAARRARRPEGRGRAGVLRRRGLGRDPQAAGDALQRHGRHRHRGGRREPPRPRRPRALLEHPAAERLPGQGGHRLRRGHRAPAQPARPDPHRAWRGCSSSAT